jgi:hypothetical protein
MCLYKSIPVSLAEMDRAAKWDKCSTMLLMCTHYSFTEMAIPASQCNMQQLGIVSEKEMPD